MGAIFFKEGGGGGEYPYKKPRHFDLNQDEGRATGYSIVDDVWQSAMLQD